VDYARSHLRVPGLPDGEYLTVFGQYVIKPQLFEYLEEHIRNNVRAELIASAARERRADAARPPMEDRIMLRRRLSFSGCVVFGLLAAAAATAQELAPIRLPAPVMEGGKPLMEALKLRQSAREFAPDKLPLQTLANLLWAAWGINRPDGHRTAPSASNRRRSTSTSRFLKERSSGTRSRTR
jgi:hypothetical protein